ncbi:MAG: hypothetical protein KDE27_02345 [Planctomycetes bacterium]|nr:hypothetical protein [Planctomycetota bacterium]
MIVLLPFLLSGCAIGHGIDTLANACPPPEFGRPAYVRFFAGAGAWIGGIVGGVASIVALPVTYPISLLADDQLGESGRGEFLFAPALGAAAVGHALLGGATDVVDYTFRRAWVGTSDDPVTAYDFVPAEGPSLPQPADAGR